MGSAEQGEHGGRDTRLELVVFSAGDEALVTLLPGAGRVTIGRDEANDIRIEDASISRNHAVLHVGDVLRVEDRGSTNGTFVRRREERSSSADTRKVLRMAGESQAVELGDHIVFGSVVAHVRKARESGGSQVDEGLSLGSKVVVQDPVMRALYDHARLVARSSISVLLLGETGVGKEILARAIHEASPRARGPFVAIHAASLSESLLESELFGHKKGAFTGAIEDKKGLFELGAGGTVFLDEIGELSREVQVKLLRVLEDRTVLRIGDRTPRAVDVRFIAATNRDLEEEIKRGAFRSDLYYRLNSAELLLPPLRERRSEILPLAKFFLSEECRKLERPRVPTISTEAADILSRHSFPGNVRELRNAMDRAAVLCLGDVLLPEHLPARIVGTAKPKSVEEELPAFATLKVMPVEIALTDEQLEEKRQMEEALVEFAGNQTRAAEKCGMSRRTFVSRLKEYNLPRPRKK